MGIVDIFLIGMLGRIFDPRVKSLDHSEEELPDPSARLDQSMPSTKEAEKHEDDLPEARSFFTDDDLEGHGHEDSDGSSFLTEEKGKTKVGDYFRNPFAKDDDD